MDGTQSDKPEAEAARDAYTKADVAKRWGCSERTVHREIDAGRLGHFRIGRLVRISQEDLDKYRESKHRDPDTAP